MAVTVISYPEGHKLAPTLYSATISNSGGDALITHSSGVQDGTYIYIDSNFERYNGFKYVVQVSPTTFKIKELPASGNEVGYIQDADITFQASILEHAWQSIHLPIVYDLQSDLYPENIAEEAETHKTIDSFSNSNGYTQIETNIDLVMPEPLEYVSLVGNGVLAGQYQIIDVIDNHTIVLNLTYDASYDFSPYHVLKYFNNYFIEVIIYSGLSAAHRWYDEKPSTEVARIRLIPDADNRIRFSISEILKGSINVRNNLNLDTLPNNIDFYTQFRISYRECYDDYFAGEIVLYQGPITDDVFPGHAVNSMTPFKSLYQGFMSDYIPDGETPGRWLTLFDRPIAIVGYFFDISFLLTISRDIIVTVFKQTDTIVDSEVIEIDNPGLGVIRIPLEIESGYKQYCVIISSVPIIDTLSLSAFSNAGSGVSWTTGSSPTVTVGSTQESKILASDYTFVTGVSYKITVNFTYNVSSTFRELGLGVYNSSNALQEYSSDLLSGSGSGVLILNFTATPSSDKIGFHVPIGFFTGGSTFTITSGNVEESPPIQIAEKICIDIISDCDSTFIDDNLRITEDDLFREIE